MFQTTNQIYIYIYIYIHTRSIYGSSDYLCTSLSVMFWVIVHITEKVGDGASVLKMDDDQGYPHLMKPLQNNYTQSLVELGQTVELTCVRWVFVVLNGLEHLKPILKYVRSLQFSSHFIHLRYIFFELSIWQINPHFYFFAHHHFFLQFKSATS